MATTKTFNDVRLQLKYDSYSAWSSANPVLLKGEIAMTTVPTKSDGVEQVPAVLMKVGDGTTAYNDLKFASALAANVYDWALAKNKPTYSADEIVNLDTFINTTIKDTNTKYQIVKVDAYNYKLQYKELDGEWTDVEANGAITIPKYDDTQLKADIAALKAQVGTGNVEDQINDAITALNLDTTYDSKGSADSALTSAKAYTDTLANGAVATNTAAIAAIKDGETIDSFADVESEFANVEKTITNATSQALTDAKSYADGKDAAITAAANAASAAQKDVDALESKVGDVASGKTLVDMIGDAKTEATYDDTEVRGLITANTGEINTIKADYLKAADKTALQGQITSNKEAIDKLNGAGEGSIDKKIDDAFNDFATKVSDDSVVNTYKELIDYAAANDSQMTTVAANIKTNANDIDALEGRATNLEGRMDTAESDINTLEAKIGNVIEDKTLVDMIGDAKDTAITAATYNDTEVRGLIKTNSTDIDKVEERATTLEQNAVLNGDTLILNCGNSVIA